MILACPCLTLQMLPITSGVKSSPLSWFFPFHSHLLPFSHQSFHSSQEWSSSTLWMHYALFHGYALNVLFLYPRKLSTSSSSPLSTSIWLLFQQGHVLWVTQWCLNHWYSIGATPTVLSIGLCRLCHCCNCLLPSVSPAKYQTFSTRWFQMV